MQMLGVQALFGFQLQSVFQERFAMMPPYVRLADGAALSLTVLSLGFLVAGPAQHRLVEHGNATPRILSVANRFAELALLPLALAMGLNVYVAGFAYMGWAALAMGVLVTVGALTLWYGAGAWLKPKDGRRPMHHGGETALHEKIDQMLTEARVILPGAQTLMGFQFIVTMSSTFARLPADDRLVHFLALGAVGISVMLLITPAAVHRIAFGGEDVARFHRIGSGIITMALLPLSLGLMGDFYIAVSRMMPRQAAVMAATTGFLVLAALWYAIPLALRRRGV